MNKKGQQSSSCNQTPNSKMVEATHLQSMKSSRACQLLWLQYLPGTDKMLSWIWYFLPTSVTHSLEKRNREMGFISLKRRTRRKASRVKQELRDKGRERHALKGVTDTQKKPTGWWRIVFYQNDVLHLVCFWNKKILSLQIKETNKAYGTLVFVTMFWLSLFKKK